VHETVSIVQDFNNQYPDGVVIIRGATATGKTSLSVSVAEHMNVEVISADSRQVYKGMNIATDTVEQRIRDRIPHHMIDIIDPDESFSV
jgi:tRNA dimethylallyltransferase